MDALLARTGLQDREAELRDEHCWFADSTRTTLFSAAAEVLGDPAVARHVGESAIDLNVGDALKLALRALGSPSLIYSNVVRASAKFNAVHRMETLELRDGHARVRNVPIGGAQWHPSTCPYNIGLLSSAPRIFGQPPARVRHPICIGTGASECIYEVTWSDSRVTRSVAAMGAAAVGSLAGAAALAPPALPFAAAGAAAALVWAGARGYSARRRRWRTLEHQLREESDSAAQLTASLKDLVSDLDLEEVLAKVTRNAQAAVGGTEFALLIEEDSGLRCRGSSGLPEAARTALERWAGGAPRLAETSPMIDDLAEVPELAGLASDPQLPLRSLCAASLTFRDQRLGVLISLSAAPKGFLPRDVELLGSYAAQAAVALTNARLYAAQEERASRDALTGLFNHREFHERLGQELDRCRRSGGRIGLAVFDLDDFKLVNDTGGHAEGDRVLRAFAEALGTARRAGDVAFRIGGDKFALILPEADTGAAAAAAARVQRQAGDIDRRVHVSFGVASWPDAGPGKDAVLALADENLYIAKRSQSRAADQSRGPLPEKTPEQVRLASASRLAAKLAPLLDPADIARTAVEEMHATFGHFLVVIHRIDPDGKLRPVAAAGELVEQSPSFARWEQPVQTGVNGRTARTGEPTLVADTRHYPDFIAAEDADETRSELALPIRVGGEVWGVLNLEDREPGRFGPDDILFGDTIASAVGAALHRSHLFGELEGAFTRTLAVLSDALEAKDPYTAAHAREVAELSDQVGRMLGMPAPELRTLRYAALLHDIGKIGVRTELLRKDGPLTDEEFEEVKRHTVIGADMLARIPFFAAVHPLVRSAHERWDGQGYPDGLLGEAIPFGARVICACDALHAMTSHRTYRSAMTMAQALDELRANAGTQFDPSVVEALLAVSEESSNGHVPAELNGVPRRRARDHAVH